MVSQLAAENVEDPEDLESIKEKSTEADTLNDLFDSYQNAIELELGASQKRATTKSALSSFYDSEYFDDRIDENLYMEDDKTAKSYTVLPKKIATTQAKSNAINVAFREQEAYNNLKLPGFNRNLMPAVPTKSQRLREAEMPQFYPFSTMPI
jgi:hypothetical protein